MVDVMGIVDLDRLICPRKGSGRDVRLANELAVYKVRDMILAQEQIEARFVVQPESVVRHVGAIEWSLSRATPQSRTVGSAGRTCRYLSASRRSSVDIKCTVRIVEYL